MDLHGAVRHATHHFGTEHLRARSQHADLGVALAGRLGVVALRAVAHHRQARVQLGLAVGQHALNQLEVADGLAELLALLRIGHGVGNQPVRHAAGQRGDMQAATVEHLHRGLEAHARYAADDVGRGHAHVFQHHVAGLGAALTHLLVRLAERDPRRIGGHDERRDARRARAAGARHQREGAGTRRVGDEALGAVDDVVVAIQLGARLQRGGVGAGVRLGQRERDDQLAAGDLRQVFLLLRLGAVHQDALRADANVGAEHRAERKRRMAEVIDHIAFLRHRQANTTVVLGNGDAEQAHLLHVGDDLGWHFVQFFQRVFRRLQPFVDKTLHRGAQQGKRFGVEGHGKSPGQSSTDSTNTMGVNGTPPDRFDNPRGLVQKG
ncbi:hypothetical protein D3C72_1215520 [compost metagenome]